MSEPPPHLARFQKWPWALRIVYARARTFIALACGIVVYALLPDTLSPVTRLLMAWDVFAALYLLLVYAFVLRSGIGHIRQQAALQDDGRFLILIVTAIGAFASIAAIVFELGQPDRGGFGVALAVATIALSWTVVHTTFALHYAHDYYSERRGGGLAFPGDDRPDYWDFVYFSFVIGMTAQVSDVGITSKAIRRTATAHGIVSFVFNTALLALTINIAAGLIS
ncbi:MAG: DUF1345 domain-containing protein [Proteobacteria bacterium]|nr:MAG: DUF1345 domain-containing protein [Pseudomonadota bacterium]